MKFKKFAAIILMSAMIGSMTLGGCGIKKSANVITMESDSADPIEVSMGYANFAARIQQANYDNIFVAEWLTFHTLRCRNSPTSV